ncbi:beta-N-acetylhexosaminidase [Maribacter ulvicola]|uniref:beta-N-acetylhexosaminidase n=1 Tax=Maribacter ulvicola TaxID=228959 RepID=A0A1N6ZY47_9FLAO|nr:family 20 glycosylhydrolase [Maribacter ulvicola]SIR31721.1 hexosaminidase [Maribacter ulvicola]
MLKTILGKTSLLVFVILISYGRSMAADIIPKPERFEPNGEVFLLHPSTKIQYGHGLEALAAYLGETLSPATGWDFELSSSNRTTKNSIQLSVDPQMDKKEGYRLLVTAKNIQVIGNNEAGVFNGIQTLRQMLPIEIFNSRRQKGMEWAIEGAYVEDAPAYSWRGMMLDVSRYFYEVSYVKQLVDMMAIYKMNVLHLHLIDDAGWRLEIKKYPKLTAIGGFRGEGSERTGGYYTQEEIKDIVAYAALRNIEVIPEIEIPAHTLPALAAYPHLSCTGEPQVVQTQHSISGELYCVGKESTFDFLEDVFDEVVALFPSKYIHIGGDEAKYDRWAACAHCQKRKETLGLDKESDLQVYFTNRIQKVLKNHEKTIVGWDEIIERGLDDKAVGMVWRNKKKAALGAEAGHDMVMALSTHAYFDVAESKIPGEVKAATWLPPISLEKVYSMDPMVEGLKEEYRSQVLGVQATLWSDQFIHGTILQEILPINENRSEKYFDYLTFPRMAAIAEVAWTEKKNKDWSGFENRMQRHYNRYDEAGYGYRVPQPKLISTQEIDGSIQITLENVVKGAHIAYTVNGLKPTTFDPVYSGPVTVDKLSDFKAITVVNRHQFSLPLYFPEKYEQYKKYGALLGEWKPSLIKGVKFGELEFNATGKIDSNGTYEITFIYTGGAHKLEIEEVSVYKNRKLITSDIHLGETGISSKENTYLLKIDAYETGAEFKIKTKVRGDIGNDSNGVVFIKKKE